MSTTIQTRNHALVPILAVILCLFSCFLAKQSHAELRATEVEIIHSVNRSAVMQYQNEIFSLLGYDSFFDLPTRALIADAALRVYEQCPRGQACQSSMSDERLIRDAIFRALRLRGPRLERLIIYASGNSIESRQALRRLSQELIQNMGR